MITTTRRRVTALCVGVLTAVAIGSTAASAQAASTQDAPRCSTGALPDSVMGSPAVKPGQATGFYLWHGSDGYALRVTHPGSARVVFSGTLTASRRFSHVARVALERNDVVRLSADHSTLTFRFTNVGRIDGINFAADCSGRLRVSLRVNGALAGPELVKLGKHRTSPTSNPFTIERAVGPTRAPASTGTPSPSSSPTAATPTVTVA